jgi:glycolate oxidase FAD binding subunit
VLLRDSTGPLLFVGAGTKQQWGGTPHTPELVIDTRGMNSLITHSPADMTASVQAGMALSGLQRTLAQHGQWLAIDPPSEAAGATVGGLLASGESGPRRLRYGTLRDLTIGATVVLADGTIAHTGGQVIKNVAGYDLTKLMYGSLGTLGLITEVVLRLHPLTDASTTIATDCTVHQATALTLQLMASPLEPSAIEWHSARDESLDLNGPGLLKIRYDGRAVAVKAQAALTRDLIANASLSSQTTDDSDTLWKNSTKPPAPIDESTWLRAGTKPSDLPTAATGLAQAADQAGCRASLISQCAVGIHTARLTGPLDAQANCITSWRNAVLDLDGNLLVQDRTPALDDHLDVLGPPLPAVQLLRNVKARLDPAGRCAPGRFGIWY